jgi:hypothetical protein
MFRAVMSFGLITSSVASETSDVLVDAIASFAVTIQQQFEMLVGDPAPAEPAKKTIDYATAKTAYFYALRAEVSELIDIATSRALVRSHYVFRQRIHLGRNRAGDSSGVGLPAKVVPVAGLGGPR